MQDAPTRIVSYLQGLHILVVGRGTLGRVSRSVPLNAGSQRYPARGRHGRW